MSLNMFIFRDCLFIKVVHCVNWCSNHLFLGGSSCNIFIPILGELCELELISFSVSHNVWQTKVYFQIYSVFSTKLAYFSRGKLSINNFWSVSTKKTATVICFSYSWKILSKSLSQSPKTKAYLQMYWLFSENNRVLIENIDIVCHGSKDIVTLCWSAVLTNECISFRPDFFFI